MTTRPAGTAGSPTPASDPASASSAAGTTASTAAAAGPSMSDSLRDRIAAALLSNRAGSNLYEEERYELADAVIAALGPELVAARYHKEYCRR